MSHPIHIYVVEMLCFFQVHEVGEKDPAMQCTYNVYPSIK